MTEVEITEPQSVTTYGWLSSLPLAASAGTAVYNMYEGSKNYNCVTQYALGTVESSVKMAASAVAPVVKKLDKPIQAVDSFTASKLVQLEEKVPAVKSQPEEVVTYITESKEALANKIIEGRAAIRTRLSTSKDNLANQLASGKEVVCSKVSAGTEAIVNSRAGVAVSEGKQMITCRLAQGKEAVGNTIASGRDAVYTKVQSGTDYLASTRAGSLVGSGVDRTLTTTENWVEYLLPEIENEKELFECEMKEEDVSMVGLPRTRRFSDDSPAQEEEADVEAPAVGRVDRVYSLSHKVKLRMYFHSMQRLQSMQQNCQTTLLHLKQTVDLLKLAQATRDGMDQRYQNMTTALKDFEDQIKQLLSRQSNVESVSWLPKDTEEDESEVKVDWITPTSQGIMQSSLDRAKQLSEKVYHAFKSVTVATTYLPGHLRERTTQGYQYAQEMYSTLKQVRSPTDLKASSLNSMSSLLETQLGYISQLGTYLSSVLKSPATSPPAEDDESEDSGDKPSGSDQESAEEPAATEE